MLGSPLIWWGGVGLGLLLAAGGVGLIVRSAVRGRRGGSGRVWAGVAAAAVGVGGVAAMYAYGPWWRHAPTWALIRAFPTHAPRQAMEADGVGEELLERAEGWEMAREDRERLAAVCGEVIREGRYPPELGVKAIEIMVVLKEEKYEHTGDLLAGLAREELRWPLLAEMTHISDMGPAVRGAMMRIVADETMGVRERGRAAWVLTVMGPGAAEAVEVLEAALDGPDAESGEGSLVRAAARALGRIGPAARREGVLARLDAVSEDESKAFATRYTARVAAACVRGTVAGEAQAHAAMLRSEDVRVRRRAALGLRWPVDMRESGVAVRELLAAMGDGDETVSRTALETLRRLVAVDARFVQIIELASEGDPALEARMDLVMRAFRE